MLSLHDALPIFLMGDFNSPATSTAYAAIVAPGQGALHDSRTVSRTPHYGPLGTFTGFDIARMDASPIAHIFVSDDVAVLSHATLTDQNRSEERRVGKECVSQCRSRWSPLH